MVKLSRARDNASGTMPGNVIQVVTLENKARTSQSHTGSTILNLSNMELAITPKKNNSKFIIQVRWFGEFSDSGVTWNAMFGLSRNGTQIGIQTDAAGNNGIAAPALSYYAADGNSTGEGTSYFVEDSPNTTSTLTYRATFLSHISGTIYTNRTAGWAGQGDSYETGTSAMIIMEIAQ